MRPDTGITLNALTRTLGGELLGDGDTLIHRVRSLAQAQSGDLSFLSNPRYRKQLETTRASAVIVDHPDRDGTSLPRIITTNPYAYLAKVLNILYPAAPSPAGVHPRAVVHPEAKIAASASIGTNAVIEANAVIAERAVIGAGAYVGAHTEIGADTRLYPGVVIYGGCLLGARVIVHSGAVIGADGFGLAHENQHWLKIPQIGRVCIGDDVEIGANTTIDRGALEDTVIEEGVKLDNQIQVAHNVRIGAHTAIAGCVGIAGSAEIGKHCMIGGAAMILGHLQIADGTTISTGTLVSKSITEAGVYSAMWTAMPHRSWLKEVAQMKQISALAARVRELEKKIGEEEAK